MFHAVTWPAKLGGAGITPGVGKWKNITASFPLHDRDACSDLMSQWNRKTNLTMQDLDAIRALFGEKASADDPMIAIGLRIWPKKSAVPRLTF